MHKFPLIHRANNLIVEDSQVGQVLFFLDKSVLALSKHFFLRLSGNGFQEDLLYHLPGHRGETDQSIVPWIVLLALSENEHDLHLFSNHQGPILITMAFRGKKQHLAMILGNSLSTITCTLPSPADNCMSSLHK